MGGPGLEIRHRAIEDHPDTALVTLEGSIGPSTMVRFKTELQGLAADGTRRFILDCEALEYVNSGGIAYLISLAGEIEPEGGTISLSSVDPKIMVIFKMMGLLDLFTFYPSFAEALEVLRAEEEPTSEHPQVPEEPEVAFQELPDLVATPSAEPSLDDARDDAVSTESAGSPDRPEVRPGPKPIEALPPAPRENLIFRLFRRLFHLGEKVG